MRIVQLVTRRQLRGAEVFAGQLSDALAVHGHEVHFVGLYPESPGLETSTAAWRDLSADAAFPVSLRLVRELGALLRALKPDLVQANGSDTLKYSVLAKRSLRAGWPLVYRNISIASHWLRYPGHRYWGRWLIRHVDHVAAVSEMSREDMVQTFRVPDRRVTTIPIGTPVPRTLDRVAARERLIQEVECPPDAEILMHVGSMSEEKNHLWMVDSFGEVRKRRTAAHLVLVGDGPLRERVGERVATAGLGRFVHFLGARADAADLTEGADLLLLPSRIEGIPGVILEAAARQTTCVATDVGSVHEAVVHGTSGLLVPPDGSRGFAEAIIALLADGPRRLEMGRAAREQVLDRFEISRIVDAFEDLYAELVTGHDRSAV
jgi:glycosyltransferase involved in cell wall biosynthesis